MPLHIEQSYFDEMVAHARADAPNECCGILLGRAGRIARFRRCRNAEQSPYRYRVDGPELLAIENECRSNSWEILAIYHSHTHTPAYPSQTDVQLAAYPDAAYILVSLQNPEQPDVRAYSILDGAISELPIEIVPDKEAADGN